MEKETELFPTLRHSTRLHQGHAVQMYSDLESGMFPEGRKDVKGAKAIHLDMPQSYVQLSLCNNTPVGTECATVLNSFATEGGESQWPSCHTETCL